MDLDKEPGQVVGLDIGNTLAIVEHAQLVDYVGRLAAENDDIGIVAA
jgi:hypothetical protein